MSAMFENINISKAAISVMADLRVKDDRYEIYDLEMEEFVLSVTYLNPNKCTRGHKHDYEEAYYFAQGCGRVKLDRRIVNVKNGMIFMMRKRMSGENVQTTKKMKESVTVNNSRTNT